MLPFTLTLTWSWFLVLVHLISYCLLTLFKPIPIKKPIEDAASMPVEPKDTPPPSHDLLEDTGHQFSFNIECTTTLNTQGLLRLLVNGMHEVVYQQT
jgi:hypothetical protein